MTLKFCTPNLGLYAKQFRHTDGEKRKDDKSRKDDEHRKDDE